MLNSPSLEEIHITQGAMGKQSPSGILLTLDVEWPAVCYNLDI